MVRLRLEPSTTARKEIWIGLLLTFLTLIAFYSVRTHGFVKFDDGSYVFQNDMVTRGLSGAGLVWAFTGFHASNWHPVTWLSHMLDVTLYGLNPGAHHLTNVILHIINTLLLFYFLRGATGHIFPSAFVAGLFALHPLHVESVAWVAERKDMLCGLFWMLTLVAYGRYAAVPEGRRYWPIVILFALGLMAKPMLVTLPFVLLLLDVWPFARIRLGRAPGFDYHVLWRRVGEKIPLFLLSAASGLVTLAAQQSGGAIRSLDAFPLSLRVGHALVTYVRYLGKTVWPMDLTVLYPHPHSLIFWHVAGALVLIGSISVLALKTALRLPYFLVGWFWYLGTLLPVIGLVQVGSQAMADRYTYIPLIGIFIIVGWGARAPAANRRLGRALVTAAAGVIMLVLLAVTRQQVAYWQSSITLFSRALDVTRKNPVARNNLALALVDAGKTEAAIEHFRTVLRDLPDSYKVHTNLGVALARTERFDDAVYHYREALRIKPGNAHTHYNLGNLLAAQGKLTEAVDHYHAALASRPEDGDTLHNLGLARMKQGRLDDALRHMSAAIRYNPNDAKIYHNLGVVLFRKGNSKAASSLYKKSLSLDPGLIEAHQNLGILLFMQGKFDAAGRHFKAVLALDPNHAGAAQHLKTVLEQRHATERDIFTPKQRTRQGPDD